MATMGGTSAQKVATVVMPLKATAAAMRMTAAAAARVTRLDFFIIRSLRSSRGKGPAAPRPTKNAAMDKASWLHRILPCGNMTALHLRDSPPDLFRRPNARPAGHGGNRRFGGCPFPIAGACRVADGTLGEPRLYHGWYRAPLPNRVGGEVVHNYTAKNPNVKPDSPNVLHKAAIFFAGNLAGAKMRTFDFRQVVKIFLTEIADPAILVLDKL